MKMTDSTSKMAKFTPTLTHRTNEIGNVKAKTTGCMPFLQR